jgi:group I intron endonuclease
MVGIYKITSPAGKIYIGQSWDIAKRKNKYAIGACKSQVKLYNSIIKHTWNNHVFEVVYQLPKDVTQETLNTYELIYFEAYKEAGFYMLNIREVGSNGKLSEETKRKMSESRTGKKVSEEAKVNMSKGQVGNKNWLGKKHTEESKNKIREKLKGNKNFVGKTVSEEHRKKISEANKNPSPETRLRMSLAQKGRVVSEETRLKLRNINLGKKRSTNN